MLADFRPERKVRGFMHVPPAWVADSATFFITINCRVRGFDQLTKGDIPRGLFAAISFYHEQRRWFPGMVLVMPDHLHALINFSWELGSGMRKLIRNWKHYTARQFGVRWQRDFFDHRIRDDEDHLEKWAYIRDNPVRAGLVRSFEDWPYVWFPERVGW